jgi:hypothetical protein
VQELRGRGPFQVLYRRIRIYRICRQHQLLSRPPELEDHIIQAVADWCLGAKMMQYARGKMRGEKKANLESRSYRRDPINLARPPVEVIPSKSFFEGQR